MEIETVTLPLKVQRCVFCAATVSNNFISRGEEEPDPQQVFMDGLAVISESLNLPGIIKFSNKAVWQLLGFEDFIGAVCCNDCYSLVSNLVTLRQLILSTQASLNDTTERLKAIVFQSEEVVRDTDLEYSINACVELRNELLQKFANTLPQDKGNDASNSDNVRSHPASPREGCRRTGTSPTYTAKEFETPPKSASSAIQLSSSVIVKLERIDAREFLTERVPDSVIEDEHNDASSLKSVNHGDSDDDEFTPEKLVSKRKRGKRVRRSQKNNIENASINSGTPRKRGRPRKINHKKDGKTNAQVKELNEEDDDIFDGEDPDQKVSDSADEQIEKKPGRPRKKVWISKVVSGSERNFKPVYAVNVKLGVFIFHNVKFQRNLNTLQCYHPGCEFSQSISQFGAEQVAFQKFRFHVNKCHRTKYRGIHPPKQKVEKWYWCCSCDTQHPTVEALIEHRRIQHPEVPALPAFCEVCGDTTLPKRLRRHLLTHNNAEETQFALQSSKKRHARDKIKLKNESFPCDECSKVFICKTDLRMHKESHIPLEIRRQWVCDTCGKKFISSVSMDLHKRKFHLKEFTRSLVCPVCDKAFYSCNKTHYDNHVRSHSGDKSFQCPTCGKGFYSKSRLVDHEKLHNDVPVQCEFCTNIYKNAKYLKKHHKKHHPHLITPSKQVTKNRPVLETFIGPQVAHPCEPCGHQYRYRSQLVSHLKGKHNMKLASNEDYPPMWTYQDEYGEASALYDPQLGGNPALIRRN